MQATVHGVAKSRTRLSDFTFTFPFNDKLGSCVIPFNFRLFNFVLVYSYYIQDFFKLRENKTAKQLVLYLVNLWNFRIVSWLPCRKDFYLRFSIQFSLSVMSDTFDPMDCSMPSLICLSLNKRPCL